LTSGTPDLVALWQRFTDWLGAHAPADLATLRPGCADGELGRPADGLGFAVHDDMAATLELHDGVVTRRASTEPGAFLLGYGLLDVDGILEAHRDLVATVEAAREEGEEDLVVGPDGRYPVGSPRPEHLRGSAVRGPPAAARGRNRGNVVR
jgi:cell wall assembly regulator SMI1